MNACVRYCFCRLGVMILLLALGRPTFADFVVPSDRVTSGVVIRKRPTSDSPSLGLLRPGDRLEFAGFVPGWNRVQLANGQFGFTSKSWTQVVEDAVTPSGPPLATVGDFMIHAVDVGTGLALLVKGPDFILIFDGGSNDDTARGDANRLVAYMRAAFPDLRGVNHLILSHPHRDHVELLPDILRAYDVQNVWDSGAVNNICGYRDFIMTVSQKPGVTYRSARNEAGTHAVAFKAATCYGQTLPQANIQLAHGPKISNQPVALGSGASMTFLHADGSDQHGEFNKNSLVVRLDLGNKRILLMGDAEAGGRAGPANSPRADSIEGALLACCLAQLRANVLVVGHHGSMTSSRAAFLDAVGADLFIVSAGPTKYGSVVLPDRVVIDELSRRGRVFRTDINDGVCATQRAKIGPDNDGNAGGCDNVRVTIPNNANAVEAKYWRAAD
jgi:beta-lactamase superfamily II metal-dependent hydrolase